MTMTGKSLTAAIVKAREDAFVRCCDKCRTAGGGFGDEDYSFSFYCPDHGGMDNNNGNKKALSSAPWWYTAQIEMGA